MTTMIEKVAKTLHDRMYSATLTTSELAESWIEMRETFLPDARAAIEAMREPTDEMKKACMPPAIGTPMESFVAMIDAALGIPNPRNLGW